MSLVIPFRPSNIPTGLVGYWKFNNDATDSSGKGYDLTGVNTPAYAVDDYWKSGEYSCDLVQATPTYFTVANNADLCINDRFTIAAWIKCDDTTTVDLIGNVAAHGVVCFLTSSAYPKIQIHGTELTSATAISVGKWQHLVYQYDQTNVTIYVDGNLIYSVAHSTDADDTTTAWKIGGNTSGGNWDGHIKDLAIWNHGTGAVLTPIQIKSLALGVDLSSYAYRPNNVSTQPTHWWKLNEVSGNRADSVSTNPLTLTDNNTVLSSGGYVEGVGANFVGANSEWLSASDSSDWDFGTGDFTISFWLDFTVSGYNRPFEIGNGAGTDGVGIIWSATDANFYLNTTLRQFAGWGQKSGWYHWVLRRKSSDTGATLKFYIDGVQYGSAIDDSTNIASTVGMSIGSRTQSGYLSGKVQDFAIWKGYALTDAEIKSLACALPIQRQGIVSYWKGADINDSIGTNTLTNNNSVTFAAAQVGNGFVFNGSNQSMTVADNATLDIDNEIFMALWCKPDANQTRSLFGKGQNNYEIQQTTADHRIYLDSTNVVNTTYLTSTAGVWGHLAYTCTGANVDSYKNGERKDAYTTTKNPTPNATALSIGNGDSGYYDGMMNEIILSARYWRPEEIKAVYLKGLNGKEVTSSENMPSGGRIIWIT